MHSRFLRICARTLLFLSFPEGETPCEPLLDRMARELKCQLERTVYGAI